MDICSLWHSLCIVMYALSDCIDYFGTKELCLVSVNNPSLKRPRNSRTANGKNSDKSLPKQTAKCQTYRRINIFE